METIPLRTFLYIYECAERECYIEFMRGAKALYKYLAPIDFPAYTETELATVPTGLQGYTSQELARAIYDINFKGKYINTELLTQIENTITLCYIREVIPLLHKHRDITHAPI